MVKDRESQPRQERTALCDALDVSDDVVRQKILDLGLEDDIPLWELADTCRAADMIADGTVGVEALAGALMDLARKGEIKILVGPWDDAEPRYADLEEAEQALMDMRQFSVAEETAHDLQRLYYVNVDNLPG